MNVDFTSRLYDTLHAHESRYRRDTSYPVHKRLRFSDPAITDIYDWIAANTSLPAAGAILDAGCGTGFGALRLAERSDAHVTGISISEREIEAARLAASRSAAQDRLVFERKHFDDVPKCAFDLIVAVESLKHSTDLPASLRAISGALRPGGTIVIVEDCFSGNADDRDAQALAANWGLTSLYSEADYCSRLTSADSRAEDLTTLIRSSLLPGRLGAAISMRLRRLARRSAAAGAKKAFAGGQHLENLYAAGKMRYKALLFTMPLESDS